MPQAFLYIARAIDYLISFPYLSSRHLLRSLDFDLIHITIYELCFRRVQTGIKDSTCGLVSSPSAISHKMFYGIHGMRQLGPEKFGIKGNVIVRRYPDKMLFAVIFSKVT